MVREIRIIDGEKTKDDFNIRQIFMRKDIQNIKIQKFDSHMKSFVVGSKSNCSDVYNYNVTIISRINR